MHFVDVLMYVLFIALVFSLIRYKSISKSIVIALWGVTGIFIIIQILVVGARWQTYTLYVATFFVSAIIYFRILKNIQLKTWIQRTLIITSSILIGISIASVLAFPVYDLPEPSGNYLIGTESFVIEDEARFELYTEDPTDYRKTKIQIWYPAETSDGYQQAPWIEDGQIVTRALSRDIGLPFFALDHTTHIMSNAYINAPISTDQANYPIVILSHGWRGFKNLHTDYAEELASLGYIVVAIDHSYGSVATVYDDDIAYLNPEALPDRESTSNFLDYANQLVLTYASDITVTLDYLETLNNISSESRFSQKLNLNKIGLIGHSTGGGADVAVALQDNRITSVIGLDAWVEPLAQDDIENGLSVPSLFIRSETWETGENNANLLTLIEQSSDSGLYQIEGTTHYDFAMVYMYSPLTQYIGFSGAIDDQHLVSILKTLITEFFNDTLITNTQVNVNPNDWDEVKEIPVD